MRIWGFMALRIIVDARRGGVEQCRQCSGMATGAFKHMNKTGRRLFGALALSINCAGVALAHSAPVWQEYNGLLCQANGGQVCDPQLMQCSSSDAKWIIRFDFIKNTALTIGFSKPESLGGRYSCELTPGAGDGPALTEAYKLYCDAYGLGSVFRQGALFTFTAKRSGRTGMETDKIEGVQQISSRDQIRTILFTCHPE